LVEEMVLKINQNILAARAGVEDIWYSSSIQDVADNEFCISVPTRGASPMVLKKGDLIKITLIAGVSRYEFEAKVTGLRHDNIPLYVLDPPKDYNRIQLREFVRLPIVLEINYAEEPSEGKEPVFSKGNSLDLSGGGIRLLSHKPFLENTILLLKITLPLKTGREFFEVRGRVARSWPDEDLGLFQVAVQFIEISRTLQDRIVRFIFMKMSEQRRLS